MRGVLHGRLGKRAGDEEERGEGAGAGNGDRGEGCGYRDWGVSTRGNVGAGRERVGGGIGRAGEELMAEIG